MHKNDREKVAWEEWGKYRAVGSETSSNRDNLHCTMTWQWLRAQHKQAVQHTG